MPINVLEDTRKPINVLDTNIKDKTLDIQRSKLEQLDKTFIEKHPNLYGAFGVAQEFIPYVKYIDPSEREKFNKLTTQQQTRALLLETLNTELIVGGGALLKNAGKLLGSVLPKSSKIMKLLTKSEAPEVTASIADDAVREEVNPAIARVHDALKKAKPIRKEQEQIYTTTRGERIAKAQQASEGLTGQARIKAETKALGGEMPKLSFEPLKVAQPDADALVDEVYKKIPDFYDRITAGRGLDKIFKGALPQESELKLLRQVFPKEFVDDVLSKRSTLSKFKDLAYEVINVPRAIMSSFDLSAPLRQGIFASSGHPIKASKAFISMFKQFGSEKVYQETMGSIERRATYGLMKDSGLSLTEVGTSLTAREEAFMGGNLAEKIPIIGKGVRASSRAYTGFLNKLRADVFDDMVSKATKAGIDVETNPMLVKSISNYINTATGRGALRVGDINFEGSAKALNTFFFSPRLMASRLHLLNPVYYVKQPPLVRKEALKSLLAFSGLMGTTLGLAKAGGAEVSTDIRSANFGKIQIGNTRLDIMGGFQQYLRMAGQLVSGKYVSSTTGKEFTLGEGYKPLTRWEIIIRQLESKMAPPVSFAKDLLKGQDIEGKPISVPKEIGKRFVPMVAQDIYDIAKDDPDLLPLSALGVFGVGLQTYGNKDNKVRGLSNSLKGL